MHLILLACRSPDPVPRDDPAPPDSDDTDTATAPAPIAWSPCPLDYGGTGEEADCAEVPLPLRWDDPDGATIPVFVQRLPAREAPHAQVWLLQGGPGAAGNLWAGFMQALSDLDPGLELYAPDHRGTGRSARLGCPQEDGDGITEDEWPACLASVEAEWGEGLAGFSSEGAARDVEALIGRTEVQGVDVVVYGASYGTTWGHRLLQLFPNRVDGVALDATNWPDRTLEDYDRLFEQTAEALFAACAADPGCAARLGDDPWGAHVVLSELAREPVSEASATFAGTCLACPGVAPSMDGWVDWPRYDFPDELRAWADTETPLLAETCRPWSSRPTTPTTSSAPRTSGTIEARVGNATHDIGRPPTSIDHPQLPQRRSPDPLA